MIASPCMALPNYEWLKILTSTLAGLFMGVMASLLNEPIKAKIQWIINMRRVERGLALDIVTLSIGVAACKVELTSVEAFWRGLALPAFEHYWAKNREVFYDDIQIRTTAFKCQLILEMKSAVAEGRMTIASAHSVLVKTVEELLVPKERSWRQRVVNSLLQ